MAGAFAPGDGGQNMGFDGEGPCRPAFGIWRDPQMIQKLELTDEQVKQLRDADFTFREKRLELKAQLDSFRLQIEIEAHIKAKGSRDLPSILESLLLPKKLRKKLYRISL